jgi:GNAT superfamily N-acetyltransferase
MTRLLAKNASLKTRRLLIRAARVGDLDALAWLEAALGPEATLEDLRRAVEAGWGALVTRSGGEAIGVAVASPDSPVKGAASVPFLAVTPEARFRGLGGEAGLALDRYLRAHHRFQLIYAPVPEARGLAVYFWLRLGFRPLLTSDAPWPVLGLSGAPLPGIWLLRDAD